MKNLNKIIVSDCFDFIESVDDNSIDLALLDLPYFMGKGDWDVFVDERDFADFTFLWIDSLLPKIKGGGSLYIFNTPYNSSFILRHLIKRNFTFQNWITWDKRDGIASTKKRFVPNQETIFIPIKWRAENF